MADFKKRNTKDLYTIRGGNLIRDAEVTESKKGEPQVKLSTASNGIADEASWVTWYVSGAHLGNLGKLQKGDRIWAAGKPHFKVSEKGAINITCYVSQYDVDYDVKFAPVESSQSFPADEVTQQKG